MPIFKEILVPVDFSTHSAEAIRVAADMAQCYRASLTLVHVVDPLSFAVSAYEFHSAEQRRVLMAELEKSLAAAKRGAEAAGAERVETKLLEGAVAAVIVDLANTADFDLIVMGTHGRTGFKRALTGSVAETVVRTAMCPVLTVKGGKDAEAQIAAEVSNASGG